MNGFIVSSERHYRCAKEEQIYDSVGVSAALFYPPVCIQRNHNLTFYLHYDIYIQYMCLGVLSLVLQQLTDSVCDVF